jgi:hypothetical protein
MRLYRAGVISQEEVDAQDVLLGPLPPGTRRSTRLIAADIELRFRLLLTEDVTRALLYATSESVRAGYVRSAQAASFALRRLEKAGVIICIGEAAPRGKPNGTKLFVPLNWRPADPEEFSLAVERGDGRALEDLVWTVDRVDHLAGAASVEPVAEGEDEVSVGHGSSGGDGNAASDATPPRGRGIAP